MYSFDKHKKEMDVQAVLRRAIDSSSPKLLASDSELRWDSRSNRTFPLVLAPWVGGRANADGAITALSKNLSSQGLTILHAESIDGDEIVVGLWLESQAYFLLGNVRHRTPLGGGYWQIGVELTRLLTPTEHESLEKLEPLTAGLSPC
jgi:hypothetical protein